MTFSLKSYLRRNTIIRHGIIPALRWLKKSPETINNAIYRSKYHTISRDAFLKDLRKAITHRIGYAAGKIGYSEQHWMYYEIFLKNHNNENDVNEFIESLKFHGLKQEGVFPADPDFFLDFNRFYMPHIRNIDCLGICYRPWELEMIKHYSLTNKLIHYPNQKAIGMNPQKKEKSFLPYFENKKLLIICPFAEALKERATKEIFEGVWSKTPQKRLKWFNPKKVDAFEIPYGFDIETQKKYTTAIRFFSSIVNEINSRDFDIALIGAGGLAIPIASHIKNLGKVGIDLGGHLQVIFGVLGQRYRVRETWQKNYFNNWWIDLPSKYLPKQLDVCDKGAYW